jgi:hypothetical protein
MQPFEHTISAPGSGRSEAHAETEMSTVGAASAAESNPQWTHFARSIAYASSKVDPERTASSNANAIAQAPDKMPLSECEELNQSALLLTLFSLASTSASNAAQPASLICPVQRPRVIEVLRLGGGVHLQPHRPRGAAEPHSAAVGGPPHARRLHLCAAVHQHQRLIRHVACAPFHPGLEVRQ